VAVGVTVAGGLAGCAASSAGDAGGTASLSGSSPSASTTASTTAPTLLGTGTAGASTTEVAVRPARVSAGQAVDVRVKVKVYGAAATGSVVVLDGGSVLRTLALAWVGEAGSAEMSVTLHAGTHRIVARYGGDTHHTGSTSAVVTTPVAQVIAQLTVTATPVPKTRDKVRVGIAVRTHSTKLAAAGWVTLVVGGLRYTLALDATGHAHVNIAAIHGALYVATASYGGDTDLTAASGSTSFIG
jgi:hypothetical protein